jgi:hypothetical protein
VTDRRRVAAGQLATLLTLTLASTAAAQLNDTGTPQRPPGWSLTPAIGVSELWDDNPTLAAEGDVRPGDFVTSVRPSFMLGYRGRRSTLRSNYGGSFDFYRDLPEQNTRDHRADIDFTHRLTPRVQMFARDQAMLSPTTGDVADLPATVLRRQTTRMNAFRGGVESILSRRTTLNLTYATQWIDFADVAELTATLQPAASQLQGGYSHGGIGELRHRVTPRFSVGADYDIQRATIGDGAETFDVQSALAVTELALSPTVTLSGGYGHAWLTASRDGFRDSGPAFSAGLDWRRRRFAGTIGYGRTFLPSFGFGGTFQNEELRATVRAVLSRSITWSGGVTVADNDPLEPGDPTLRAVSALTSLGWVVKQRLRFEVFAQHVSQDSSVAGGHVLRTRAGVQATVFDTVRASR